MAETKEQKAHRILAEGRLVVTRIDALTATHEIPTLISGLIVAECRGFSDGELYHLGYDPRPRNGKGEWRCTCQASRDFHRVCSHLLALQLVTRKPQ